VWGGVPFPTGEGLRRGLCPLSREKMNFSLQMACFGAFWVVIFVRVLVRKMLNLKMNFSLQMACFGAFWV